MPDKPADEAAPPAPSIGECLRAARETAELSLAKLASEMMLDGQVLEHLEADRFDAIGAPVFVKGYLRKYANRLGLNADELVARYQEETGSGGELPIVHDSLAFQRARRQRRRPWLILLLLALVLVAAWWVVFMRDDGRSGARRAATVTEPEAEPEVTLETIPVVTESLVAPPGEPAGEARTGPDGTERGTEEAAEPVRRQEPAPAVAAEVEMEPVTEPEQATEPEPGPQRRPERVARAAPEDQEPAAAEIVAGDVRTVRIDLSFEQDSWVEIYDARDARLMYAMGRAGSSRSVEGEPPLRVFLGYAGGVTVRVDGDPFELTGANRRGDTARFIVRASEDDGR